MTDFNYRSKRCDDCGFTKGTKANLNGVTEIKADLCAEIPEPFYCHFNAKEEAAPGGVEFILPDDKQFLCQGWVERCNELASADFYAHQPEWQRELKITLVEAICEIEEKVQAGEIELVDSGAILNQRIAEFLNE